MFNCTDLEERPGHHSGQIFGLNLCDLMKGLENRPQSKDSLTIEKPADEEIKSAGNNIDALVSNHTELNTEQQETAKKLLY